MPICFCSNFYVVIQMELCDRYTGGILTVQWLTMDNKQGLINIGSRNNGQITINQCLFRIEQTDN